MTLPNDYHGQVVNNGTDYVLVAKARHLDATGGTVQFLIDTFAHRGITGIGFKASRILDGGIGTTKGDLLAYNGTAWVRLGVGSNGQVLSADSTAAAGVKWITGGGGGGVTDHGLLTGLSDDDHPQYLIEDGTRSSRKAYLRGTQDEVQFLVEGYFAGQSSNVVEVWQENGGAILLSISTIGDTFIAGFMTTGNGASFGGAVSVSGNVTASAPTLPGHLTTKAYVDGVDAAIISILTAPTYLTLTNDPYLANERALAAGAGINITDGGAGGSLTIATKSAGLSVAFTDGGTSRRVTITDAAITGTSKLLVSVQRPNIATEGDDTGHVYVATVVLVGTGSADVVISCTDIGFGDVTETPPNETVTLVYQAAA